jgi:ABC-type transport system involved in Fe-S cluster assembly fused permease/ATPase subunit
MEVMFDLLRRKSRIEDAPNAIELRVPPTVRGTIAFDKVSFGYEAARPILANVSFSTGGVRQTAIVGSSGSGKSTLLKLLFRFHDVDSGEISINGVPIRSATVKSLRESIALIPQDTVLFNDTIRHNIAYGKLDATDEEVSEAAKKANIHDAIMSWPDGYSTVVGERGLKISGGEKVRKCDLAIRF